MGEVQFHLSQEGEDLHERVNKVLDLAYSKLFSISARASIVSISMQILINQFKDLRINLLTFTKTRPAVA